MRYKIMKPAMEGMEIGGNPIVTATSLPSEDLNLSPSTSIPVDEQDLQAFCEKTAGLIEQVSDAEDTVMVLEGIAARLDESSVKAEARASRYVVECLCESVGIDKTDLKGNEEGADPTAADKISIVLENITEGLAKIWQAIRDAIKRFMKWVKDFINGFMLRLRYSRRDKSSFEDSYKEYQSNVSQGMKVSLNTAPFTPSPEDFKLISGGLGTPLEAIDAYLNSVLESSKTMIESFGKISACLLAMAEAMAKGQNSGLVFDRFPDIKRVATAPITLHKNGVGNVKPGSLTEVYQAPDIGRAFSVLYRLPYPEAPLRDAQDMAVAVDESAVILVRHENEQLKMGPLPVLDHAHFTAAFQALQKYDSVIEGLGDILNDTDKITKALLAAVDRREKEGNGNPEDTKLFSSILDAVSRLVLVPGSQLYQFLHATTGAPNEYLRHTLK